MSTKAARTCVVIDTNVLMVAEGMYPQASDACTAACIGLARSVEQGLVVGVDADDAILTEYIGALRQASTSGVGKKLAIRLFRLRRDTRVCRQVAVTRIEDPDGSFEEVPDVLRDFDIDDQKFVAVAAAEEPSLQIYTAVDREWWDRRQNFVACGLDVQFLCASDFLERESGLKPAPG